MNLRTTLVAGLIILCGCTTAQTDTARPKPDRIDGFYVGIMPRIVVHDSLEGTAALQTAVSLIEQRIGHRVSFAVPHDTPQADREFLSGVRPVVERQTKESNWESEEEYVVLTELVVTAEEGSMRCEVYDHVPANPLRPFSSGLGLFISLSRSEGRWTANILVESVASNEIAVPPVASEEIYRTEDRSTGWRLTKPLNRTPTRNTMHLNLLESALRVAAG